VSTSTGGTRARRAASPGVPEPKPAPAPAPAPSRRALDPDELAALEDQRDFLLRSLDDLEREHDAGDVDDVDYTALKDDYTARASSVLQAIERRQTAMAASRRPRRWGQIVVAVIALAVFGIGAGWLVAVSSGQREPGETLSGDIRSSSIDELARASEYTGQATAALQNGDSPAAVEAYRSALDAYRAVLDQQPDNTEALTYRGWLLHTLALQATGDVAQQLDDDAMASLDRAADVDPTYPDARIFRAILYERAGRNDAAAADLDAVAADAVPPGMREMVDGLRERVRQAGG
jgi:tetratricopeptide (TPR) repeat protein